LTILHQALDHVFVSNVLACDYSKDNCEDDHGDLHKYLADDQNEKRGDG
jgi:hypothetical protein